ncbi:MAG: amino-acid N-acetyltransferase [Pseudomonadales bacterium]
MNDNRQHVKWFRDSSPYINAHRHRTFVLYLGGEALLHANFENIISDLVLLNSLGVRLVVVHGATPQIDDHLSACKIACDHAFDNRITTPEVLGKVREVVGLIQSDIQSRLSMGLVHSPMYRADIVVTSGNYVKAKPLGIREGIDFHNTGEVRRINSETINRHLAQDDIVLISPLGYSPSGEIFNLDGVNLAREVATSLLADKLIVFTPYEGVMDKAGQVISELEAAAIDNDLLESTEDALHKTLKAARQACLTGVNRCHLISYAEDGALLEELFTRDGSGTQVARVSYEQIRAGTPEDVRGIIELIEPLEQQGILVKRSRELLESEVEHFTVIERDGMIVSCAALYPFDNKGELACLATHEDYRNNDRGELLLNAIESRARALNLDGIFVLTTQAAHWFTERGFEPGDLSRLPAGRKSLYNYQRNSKVFEKSL